MNGQQHEVDREVYEAAVSVARAGVMAGVVGVLAVGIGAVTRAGRLLAARDRSEGACDE